MTMGRALLDSNSLNSDEQPFNQQRYPRSRRNGTGDIFSGLSTVQQQKLYTIRAAHRIRTSRRRGSTGSLEDEDNFCSMQVQSSRRRSSIQSNPLSIEFHSSDTEDDVGERVCQNSVFMCEAEIDSYDLSDNESPHHVTDIPGVHLGNYLRRRRNADNQQRYPRSRRNGTGDIFSGLSTVQQQKLYTIRAAHRIRTSRRRGSTGSLEDEDNFCSMHVQSSRRRSSIQSNPLSIEFHSSDTEDDVGECVCQNSVFLCEAEIDSYDLSDNESPHDVIDIPGVHLGNYLRRRRNAVCYTSTSDQGLIPILELMKSSLHEIL